MENTLVNGSRFKLGFLNTHPIQYSAPLYQHLQLHTPIEPVVFYLSDISLRGGVDKGFNREVKWDLDLLSGYDFRFIGQDYRSNTLGNFFSLDGPGIWTELDNGDIDALVIHGYNYLSHVKALMWAKKRKIPVYIRAETHLGLKRSFIKRLIRKPIIKFLFSWFNGAVAIGSKNNEYLLRHGVKSDNIFLVPYAVDNARFSNSGFDKASARLKILEKAGLDPKKFTVLFASKFTERKRPFDVIRSIQKLNRENVNCQLLMVGSGELEQNLKALAEKLGVENIGFYGFANQQILPEIFAAVDLFVLPSENEPWGLVVNEAMAASLPVIASREIGCVPDLVNHGFNGYIYDCGDVARLSHYIGVIATNPQLAYSMGNASLQIIEKWSYKECSTGLSLLAESLRLPSSTIA